MKKEIHPTSHPVIFRDIGAKKDFVCMSTLKSENKEKVDGVDHYVIIVDISSSSHPFYTGKQHFIDSSGRVDKFKKQEEKAQK
jgi:large subunit ribosomal protein L31